MVVVLLSSCNPFVRTPPTAAEYCGIDLALYAPEPANETIIELWATAPRHQCLRGYAPLLAAASDPDYPHAVRVQPKNVNEGPLAKELLILAARGEAPDIGFMYNDHIRELQAAGYLYPLDQCRQQSGLNDIPDAFWTKLSPDGRAWAFPVDIELMMLFYNKEMLRQLGWQEAEIDDLPYRIAIGDFTLDDLQATAKAAVEDRIARPGFGFVPKLSSSVTVEGLYASLGGKFILDETDDIRPKSAGQSISGSKIASGYEAQFIINRAPLETALGFLESLHKHELINAKLAMADTNSWGNKLLFTDAATHGRFLFWHDYTSSWQRMIADYLDSSSGSPQQDEALLRQRIGVALLPSDRIGSRGKARVINLGQYVIFTEEASSRRNQQAACSLLAVMQRSSLPQRHAQKSGQPTPRSGGMSLPDFLPSMISMEHLLWPPRYSDDWQAYREILKEISNEVEQGKLRADEATPLTVERLEEYFGRRLTVE